MSNDAGKPDPAVVLDLLQAFRGSKVMFAAVSLGVFDAVSAGTKSLGDLAHDSKTDLDALERLLDACVGLRLLIKTEGGYENTPAASAYLCKSSPNRMTGYVHYSNECLWKLWANLEDAVREGTNRWKQTFGGDGPLFSHYFRSEGAKREFLMGMHGYGLMSSPQVVAAFDLSTYRSLVDLGGATGHLAMAACERYTNLNAILFDLPEVVPIAEEIVRASSVASRIAIMPGDFFNDPLPAGDLYCLGRIVHDWKEAKIAKLLSKIFHRLPPNGALLIAEKLLDDDKQGPLGALLQDINMLTCTEGTERTLPEYEALLKKIGFAEVSGRRTASAVDAVLAVKR
jgi:acetylserotonin N-methyltransferase